MSMMMDNAFFQQMVEDNRNNVERKPGEWKAYWAWKQSVRYENGELELNDHLWDEEVQDFANAVYAAGIDSFVVTNESTALMRNLHLLEAAGCTMAGTCVFKRGRDYYEPLKEGEELLGIRFFTGYTQEG